MDQSISLRYMRTVQHLEKKKEEVDQLLRDSRELESDNIKLKKVVDDLNGLLREYETREKDREQEFVVLESHVRKQQQKLQQYINTEVERQKASSEADKLRSSKLPTDTEKRLAADLEEARKELKESQVKLLESEKSCIELRKELDTAIMGNNELNVMREEISSLKKELENTNISLDEALERQYNYRSALKQLNERQVAVAHETMQMEEIENKALEGLKCEILVLEKANQRLVMSLQEERQRYRDARSEFEKSAQLVAKQKALYEAHQAISAEEVNALTTQTEAILQDMKVITKKDGLKKHLEDFCSRNRPLSSETLSSPRITEIGIQSAVDRQEAARNANAAIQKASQAFTNGALVSSGGPTDTHTFNSPRPNMNRKDSSSRHNVTIYRSEEAANAATNIVDGIHRDNSAYLQNQVRDLFERNDALTQERDSLLRQKSSGDVEIATLNRHNGDLRFEVEELRTQLNTLRTVTREREENDNLRKEKISLQSQELERLKEELLKMSGAHGSLSLTPLEKLMATGSQNNSDVLPPLTDNSRRSAVEGERLREIVSQCLLLATTVYRLLETCAPNNASVGIEDIGESADDKPVPRFKDLVLKSAFDEAFGMRHVLRQMKNLAKALLHHRYAAVRVYDNADCNQSGLKVSKPHKSKHYHEGESLKDVVDSYRAVSPRRHPNLDATKVNLRDNLSLAQWEARRQTLQQW